MYTQNNTEAAIRRIQDYLYEIHLYEGIDYFATRNGTYTDTTQKAIMDFQKREGLPVTGIVDLYTFEKIRDAFFEYKRKSEADQYLYAINGYPLAFGASGSDVEVLHALLRSLSAHDSNSPPIPRTAYFSKETEAAIRYFQRKFQIEENGIVDALLFARLENELNARNAFFDTL